MNDLLRYGQAYVQQVIHTSVLLVILSFLLQIHQNIHRVVIDLNRFARSFYRPYKAPLRLGYDIRVLGLEKENAKLLRNQLLGTYQSIREDQRGELK